MRLQKLIFKSLLLLLPVQLGYHYWPNWSLVFGIRVDYLSPTIYLTDILVILLFALWFGEKTGRERLAYFKKLSLFLILVLINLLIAIVPQVSVYVWLKVMEAIFLITWVAEKLPAVRGVMSRLLSISLVIIAVVAVAQFITQSSLGGVFYWLGERSFNSATPGIALFNFFGTSLLRPYSIFSHPNSMAGYGLISFWIILALKQSKVTKLEYSGLTAALIIITLSFSRAAWAAFVFLGCLYLLKLRLQKFSLQDIYFGVLFSALYFSLAAPYIFSQIAFANISLGLSARQRLELMTLSGVAFAEKPIWGVGLGNFTIILPSLYQKILPKLSQPFSWWIQPVHNIFLLTLVQVGGVGLGILAYFFWKLGRSLSRTSLWLLPIMAVVITGAVDHYWLTLQQNFLFLAILSGIILGWEK